MYVNLGYGWGGISPHKICEHPKEKPLTLPHYWGSNPNVSFKHLDKSEFLITFFPGWIARCEKVVVKVPGCTIREVNIPFLFFLWGIPGRSLTTNCLKRPKKIIRWHFQPCQKGEDHENLWIKMIYRHKSAATLTLIKHSDSIQKEPIFLAPTNPQML